MAEGRGRAAGRLTLGAVLAALLAACAPGGPLKPPGANALGQTVTGADGQKLALSVWNAEEQPQAVILAVHGFGDYGFSTFREAARHWAGRGITTYAYDQRGFGRNPSRGYWPGAEALVDDLVAVAGQVRAINPCLPMVVVGHSMGGGVALAAAERSLPADGLVLAAPAIWGGRKLNPIHRVAAWLGALAMPDRRFSGRGVVSIQASDNIEMLQALGRDPLYLSPPSAREFMGLVRVTDLAERAASRVSTPTMMLLGAKDEIVPERTVREVFDRLSGPRGVRTYPDGWHLLFRDLNAEEVWDDVAEWTLGIDAASGCPVPAGPDVELGAATDQDAAP